MPFRTKAAAAAAALSLLLIACGEAGPAGPSPTSSLYAGGADDELRAHSGEFRRDVVQVGENVHSAIGWGIANSIMIEGEDGIIIVDTGDSRTSAEAMLAEFRRITDKPVKAVILTHNHGDHISGGLVFTGGDPAIPVYAHRTTEALIDRIFNVITPAISARSGRMFGTNLSPEERLNAGIGPELKTRIDDMALARPTHVFDDTLEIEHAGVKLRLIHAPGETPDQIIVWMPGPRILMPADNFYRAFPNLYTIRGTAYRDVMAWARSIDIMRDLKPVALVPSHTRPLTGEAAVMETLTAYRDAIQFVHDQTIRALNRGMTPDQAVEFVRLPEHLAGNPWLRPFYGTVPWSVRSIFTGYLGWFSGDAAELDRLPPDERARRYRDAFAAGAPLIDQVRSALDAGELLWAAELGGHLVRAEPENADAKRLLARAFMGLGSAHASANGRNYYIAQARELLGEIAPAPLDPSAVPDSFVAGLPVRQLIAAMPTRLKAEETLDADTTLLFRFTDTGEEIGLHLRRGVLELLRTPPEAPDLAITTTGQIWKEIVFQKRSLPVAVASGDVSVEGGVLDLAGFLSHFER